MLSLLWLSIPPPAAVKTGLQWSRHSASLALPGDVCLEIKLVHVRLPDPP
jgi:hypothetical protein